MGKPACTEFAIIHASAGKPGVTVQDVMDQLTRTEDPLGHARNFLGDTKQTRQQVEEHNAAYKAVCN